MKLILESDISPFKIVADLLGSQEGKWVASKAAKFFRGHGDNKVYLGGSISNYANDLIMTFPMLIDNSLSPDICSMISKANERSIVAMLHLLFSSASLKGNDGKEIIKSIYGRVNTNLSMDDYIDKVDSFVSSYKENYHIGFTNNDREANRLINETVKAIVECVKEGKLYISTFDEDASINEKALTNYKVTKDYNDQIVIREDPTDPGKLYPGLYGMYGVEPGSVLNKDNVRNANDYAYRVQMLRQGQDKLNLDRDKENNLQAYRQRQLQQGQDQIDQGNRRLAQQKQDADDLRTYRQGLAQQYNRDINFRAAQANAEKRILDTDVRKANELQPTLMVVHYNELDGDNQTIYDRKTFVCGVKSRLIAVDSSDIIDRIVSKNKTRLSFLNFIRATTGEIGLVKDFILSLDQAKIDAKNSVKKGEAAQIWKTLESLSNRNNLNKMRKNGNDASAITTLVVNKETCAFMKKQFRIDIEQPRTAKLLLDAYNLLGLFIVDESVEVVKILYRGNNMFEQQAFNYLEREDNDKSYKKVINLMGQMNR